MWSDEVAVNVDVDNPTPLVEDHKEIRGDFSEGNADQHQLLFATLTGNHSIFDGTEPTGGFGQFGPFLLEIPRLELLLKLQ